MQVHRQSRDSWRHYHFAVVLLCVCAVLWSNSAAAVDVEKWKQFQVEYKNSTWNGNPFDLEFYGTFTHTASGRTVQQLGFYAGNDTWKIYFMPDREGEWTFTTQSPDPELDSKSGSLTCVASDLPGRLVAEGNRWKLEDSGKNDVPIMIPTREWFKSTETTSGIQNFIDWAKTTVGARVVGTTLVYFSHPQEASPYIKGQEGDEFNIEMWDRLNSHYDALRDAGMGLYIMFYSDEAESPSNNGISAQSERELRLLRYAVARFSAYPIVMWDTGIDITEYRSNTWIDWFANWFNQNDPWQHPVGSRSGGGSGGKHPDNGTFWSDGASTLPNHSDVVSNWQNRNVPTAYTDRWREDGTRGGFDQAKIRRAVWEVGLVGGTALYISGNDNGGYLTDTYATDFKAAPQVGYASQFFSNNISDLGQLSPHDELLVSGDGVLSAQPGYEYVAYLSSGNSTITVDLSNTVGTLNARWYNPRTGFFQNIGNVIGGGIQTFTTPDNQDWVLHLLSSSATPGAGDTLSPAGITNLIAE